MRNYSEFHDGIFEGVWIDGDTVYVFLGTHTKERFVALSSGVSALNVTDFRKGNLIFEVITRTSEEVTVEDMVTLHYLREGEEGNAQATKLLSQTQQKRLSILEINPSYGATCLLLARSIEIISQNEWSARYLSSAVQRPI
jgi:hypothetical protein